MNTYTNIISSSSLAKSGKKGNIPHDLIKNIPFKKQLSGASLFVSQTKDMDTYL